jgi:hypothetical protein
LQTDCTETLPATMLPTAGRADQLARIWAVLGIAVLFSRAIWALGMRGLNTVAAGLEPAEWLVLAGMVGIFVYGEGFLALQRKWVPRVCCRIACLGRIPVTTRHRLLAPLYAMSLVGAPRRAVLRAWLGVAAIVTAVLLVSRFPDPWRGIVDVAVASALAWGLVAILRSGTPIALARPGADR